MLEELFVVSELQLFIFFDECSFHDMGEMVDYIVEKLSPKQLSDDWMVFSQCICQGSVHFPN